MNNIIPINDNKFISIINQINILDDENIENKTLIILIKMEQIKRYHEIRTKKEIALILKFEALKFY